MTVAVDAQLVLNWLLARKSKTSNVLVNNRLKKIWMLLEEMQGLHTCSFRFRYVPTSKNNADYLTRAVDQGIFRGVTPLGARPRLVGLEVQRVALWSTDLCV
jgi:hypothetical protein